MNITMQRFLFLAVGLLAVSSLLHAEPPTTALEQALVRAKENRKELEKALGSAPVSQRKGLVFLIENMPEADLQTLTADFLLANLKLAYQARQEVPWGKDIPEAVFLNDVLPYANVDEKRDAWRQEFHDRCLPLVKECKTPAEAAQKLNAELFPLLKVRYSTQRQAPNQSPRESIEQGKASCTGLSILLSDACRSVCVPARLVGTPLWVNQRGNHTWVEIWDQDWHFTGACEPDRNGLNRAWFTPIASQARKDSPEHAIYASSFRKSSMYFPLVWARNNKDVPAENVTDRYARKEPPKPATARVLVRVYRPAQVRVAEKVTLTARDDPKQNFEGTSRGDTADANDILRFDLPPGKVFLLRVRGVEKTIQSGGVNQEQVIDIVLSEK